MPIVHYQVSTEVFSANDVYYLLVLTGAENAAYAATAPQYNAGKIDRQFNTTLVVVRGTAADIRYRSSIRFRGNSSRGYQFKPLRVSLPLDDRLDGVSDFNLNPQAPASRSFSACGSSRRPGCAPRMLMPSGSAAEWRLNSHRAPGARRTMENGPALRR